MRIPETKAHPDHLPSEAYLMPETDDRLLLERLLVSAPFPIPLRTYAIDLTTDDDGDPAFKITLTLESPTPLPRRIATPLARFIDAIQDQALSNGVSRWPFFEVVQPPRRRKRPTNDVLNSEAVAAERAAAKAERARATRGVIQAMLAKPEFIA
jgi:hypothetical protein